MRRILNIIAASAILFVGAISCSEKEPSSASVIISDDDNLSGDIVAIPDSRNPYYKLFVLNEGQMGKNNASLDFLRFTTGTYVRSSFISMNPHIPLGLGDTANDIRIYGNTVWVCESGSGLVQVLSGVDEKAIKSIDVPGCRQITFSNGYAYVTSFAGAVYGGTDQKGKLFRISLGDYKVSSVDVGYQPEGVAVYGGKIYVANSGGYRPGYDNTITVIDEGSFQVEKTIETVTNPKNLFADDSGNLWITSQGDYYSQHSGVYIYNIASDKMLERSASIEELRVTCSSVSGRYLALIGTDQEWDWSSGSHQYYIALVDISTRVVQKLSFSSDMGSIVTPYAICLNPYTEELYISDAGDYVNPGSVHCYSYTLAEKWRVISGINPGHMALFYYDSNL